MSHDTQACLTCLGKIYSDRDDLIDAQCYYRLQSRGIMYLVMYSIALVCVSVYNQWVFEDVVDWLLIVD